MAEIGRRSMQGQVLSDRLEALARIERAQGKEIALLSRENAEAAAEAGALNKAIDDAYALLERKSQELWGFMAERDLHAADSEIGSRARSEEERLVRARLDAALAQAARHETNGLMLRREADEMKARVCVLEKDLESTNSALKQARGHEDAGLSSNSNATVSAAIGVLEAENTSLRQALASLRPAIDNMRRRDHRDEKADAELRSSIHALGLAVAAMAREARNSTQKPARPFRGPIAQPAISVEAE